MTRSWFRAATRFRKQEGGVATLEFVIAVPVMMTIFMASFETGLLMTRHIMLEQAVDVTMRDLRLGKIPNPSAAAIKQAICDKTVIFPNCTDNTAVELTRVDNVTWTMPAEEVQCVDREEEVQPVLTFVPGSENELMMVRVCATLDPIFPMTGVAEALPKDAQGGYGLVSVASFVNEPNGG
jgi:Flp pilus assembly protein TadG